MSEVILGSAGAVRARLSASPYPVLLLAAGCVLVLEALRGSEPLSTDPVWPVLQGLVAGAALAFAWRRREGLTLGATLCFSVGFHLAWIAVHLAVGVDADWDSVVVYPRDGKALLDGDYPESAYPPLAVLLFALEVLLAGGSAEDVRVSHALVMVPFQAISVAAVWLLRTRSSSWFALAIGFWPLLAFSWEFRFDSAPTAALLVGLLLASRERWTAAGFALGLGAALKWIPGLTAFGLIVWLLASRRRREAGSHALAFLAAFAAVHLPFLILAPSELIATYESQGGRGITAESLPYIPLRLLGLASSPGTIWQDAVVPDWANGAAAVGQAVVVLAVLAAVVLARGRLQAGLAAAALLPAAFLPDSRRRATPSRRGDRRRPSPSPHPPPRRGDPQSTQGGSRPRTECGTEGQSLAPAPREDSAAPATRPWRTGQRGSVLSGSEPRSASRTSTQPAARSRTG